MSQFYVKYHKSKQFEVSKSNTGIALRRLLKLNSAK